MRSSYSSALLTDCVADCLIKQRLCPFPLYTTCFIITSLKHRMPLQDLTDLQPIGKVFFPPHAVHIYCKHMQFGIRCVLSGYHWAARTQPLSVCVICMNCTSLLQTGGMSWRRQRLNTIFHYSPNLYIIKQMASLFKNKKKNRSAASRLAACSRPCTDPATVLSVMWAITWLCLLYDGICVYKCMHTVLGAEYWKWILKFSVCIPGSH